VGLPSPSKVLPLHLILWTEVHVYALNEGGRDVN